MILNIRERERERAFVEELIFLLFTNFLLAFFFWWVPRTQQGRPHNTFSTEMWNIRMLEGHGSIHILQDGMYPELTLTW